MIAVKIEGLRKMVDLCDFGELEAEVIVHRAGEVQINAADLGVEGLAEEANVKGHKIDEQPFFGVRNGAAMPNALKMVLCVNDLVVGIDHADSRLSVEDGGGSGDRMGMKEIVTIDPADVDSLGLIMGGSEGLGTSLVGGGK
jgi:hypothetical protein